MSNVVDRLRGVKSSQAIKVPCRVATTANITLSGEQTIDGVAVVEGDRVLVKNQNTASENGIYDVDSGAWLRAADWDGVGDVVTGTRVYVTAGTVNRGEWIVTTSGTITIGTTSVAFTAGLFDAAVNDSDDITEGSTHLFLTTAERAKLATGDSLLTAAQTAKLANLTVDVRDFGTVGTADDTTVFQAAIDYLNGLGGGTLRIPKGIYDVAGLVGQSAVKLKGEGVGLTSLRLVAGSATGTGIITYTSETNFHIEGINFTGQKASQTNPANLVTLITCTHYNVRHCSFFNAKGSSGSYGSGLVIAGSASGATDVRRFVCDNVFAGNDTDGLTVSGEWFLTVDRNYSYDNTYQGINIINYVFPPVANVTDVLSITNNKCYGNAKNGIVLVGYYTGGTSVAPIYGPSTPPAQFVVVANNICYDNSNYGLSVQISNASITGNVCSRNGGVSVAYAGILANGQYLSVTGNISYDNSYFGIDAGGSYNSVVSGNQISLTGFTAANTNCIGINMGGCVNSSCVGNNIQVGVTSGVGINVSGEDGNGSTGFPWYGRRISIIGNHIDLNAQTTPIGIYVNKLAQGVKVLNNCVDGASAANQAYVFEVTDIEHSGNTDGYYSAANGAPSITVASAATMVVPDYAEKIIATGTTGITSIRTYSMNVWYQRIRGVLMTNRGSSYETAPTVSFTGGGGADAAGTAILANDGTIAYVQMTNYGTGYSSAPTVGFTGGGGVDAAGTALVGCENIVQRDLDILFEDTLTVTDGSNLILAGSNFSATAADMLCLRGSYGVNWYEKSRSNN